MELLPGPQVYQLALEGAKYIRSCVPEVLRSPGVGVICGSGLGGLSAILATDSLAEIPFEDIPHFPSSTGRHLCQAPSASTD